MKSETERKVQKRLGYMITMFPRISETFILNEILELERLGFNLTIFTRKHTSSNIHHGDYTNVKGEVCFVGVEGISNWLPSFIDNLVIFILRPINYFRGFLKVMKKRLRSVWRKFFIAGRVARVILKKKIYHLHAHFAADNAKIASLAAIITGIEFSFTAHAKDIWVKSTPSSLRKLLSSAKFAVTICRYNLDYLFTLTDQPHKINLIYNSLNQEKFLSIRHVNNVDNGNLEILAVGRLVPKKGFDDLVHACRNLSDEKIDFRCRLVGSGECYSELKASIQRNALQDKVFLEGERLQEELIQDYLSKTDFLVVPCVVAPDGDRDGIPTVIIEAMFMEIPVITTPVAGIPEIITHLKTGILVKPGSGESLADGIKILHKNRGLATWIGKRGAIKAREMFDKQKNIGKLARLFYGAIH